MGYIVRFKPSKGCPKHCWLSALADDAEFDDLGYWSGTLEESEAFIFADVGDARTMARALRDERGYPEFDLFPCAFPTEEPA